MSEPWHFEKLTLPNGLGMRIARTGAGDRPPMVMLHGFPECWYSWRHQLREFAATMDCVAPEMRGYGETDAPVGVSNYTIDKLVDDVAGLINALGRQRAIVVGHDWGGIVAWATAMMRPEVVERLIIMNVPHPAKFRANLARFNFRQMARSWYILFFQLPWLPEAALRRARVCGAGPRRCATARSTRTLSATTIWPISAPRSPAATRSPPRSTITARLPRSGLGRKASALDGPEDRGADDADLG